MCLYFQAIQYIGEVCRFLLAQPAKPVDTQHSVRLAYGNGLRAHIWEEFKNRFQIAQICEFYGATEGNANVLNYIGKVGAVGFLSVLFPSAYPLKIIRLDPDTNEPVRNPSGFCEVADYNEPGELIGKIIESDLIREFSGYKGLAIQTQKKVLTNVLTKGDKYFRSGDFLKMDEEGYLYFVDRTGDTFRWHGENVSTTEIENTASKIIKNLQVACYGVEIPGAEGRAGMISIVHQDDIDLAELCRELQERLPTYAVPLFVRVVKKLEYTATEKVIKRNLREEAFNIKHIVDPIYFLDPVIKTYIPLTEDVYKKITDKEYRL